MWTLECDGESLALKFQIDHKTVSRQHLTLSVSNVRPGDGSLVHTRSEILLKDEDTKFQTEIDGHKIKGEARTLKNDEHTFTLGKSDQTFHLKWEPAVFSISLGGKELKSEDPLAKYRNRLEDLDIKVIIPFANESTTHVVATKRNTAKGLQALINARYIVTDTYIDALIYATTPTNLDEEESLSPLEEDFIDNWPKPFEHLPAKSKEPSERPSEDFIPNPKRADVFEGYKFVFCDSAQYESLHAPITSGGGKAVECKVEHGKTTTEDIVRFVKSVAGEKGLGEFEDGSEGKGVVVVKFRGKGDHMAWAAKLDHDVAQALDHRLIEQSEFLDAILANDASMLRRPLLPIDDEELDSSHISEDNVRRNVKEANGQVQAEVFDAPSKRVQPRAKIASRFKGFDSDDDDDDEAPSSRPPPIKSQVRSTPKDRVPQRDFGATSLSDEDSLVPDSQVQVNGNTQPHTLTQTKSQNTRKRLAPSSDEDEDEEELMDKMLPAAAAMKRRRIEVETDAERNGISPSEPFISQIQPKPEKKTKTVKAVNIKEVVRERKKAEEEAARQDEESLKENLEGMSMEEMKNLVVVEEMSLPERRKNSQPANGDGNRWDERWNGRKNFKKFRRRGDNTQARRGQSVIVALEEVKKKDFGIGEDYWLERNSGKSKQKRRETENSMRQESQPTPFTTARSPHVEAPTELIIDDGGEESHPVDISAPRRTRHQDQTQQTDESTAVSQVINNRKRPTPMQALGRPTGPQKRKKFAAAKDSDNDSDDD